MYQRPKSTDCLVISVGKSGISASLDICDVCKPLIIVAIRKIEAEVAAATLLPPQRGARNQPANGDDAAHAAELRIELAIGGRRPHERVPGIETGQRLLDQAPFAQ